MKIGEKAPDFVLKDNRGRDFRLEEHRGRKVLLSFHPLAWTKVCAEQMKSLESNFKRLEDLNTIAVGISVDSVPCKNVWAKQLGIAKTPLLSDFWPHGEVAKKFGIFRESDGFSERANILLDENGKIVFYKIYEISELPDMEEIISFIKKETE